MSGGMLLLTILAIVAVVLVAGAIIGVIGNMIIGAFDTGKKKVSEQKEVQQYQPYQSSVQTQLNDDYDFETINRAKEEKELAMKDSEEDEFDLDIKEDSEEDEDDIAEIEQNLKSKTSEEDDEEDLDDLLDDISDEVIGDEKNKEAKEEDVLDKYNIDTYLEENEEESDDEDITAAAVEEATQQVAIDSSKEIEQLKAELAQANEKLAQMMNAEPKQTGVSVNMTEQDCLERLATLEERLKTAKADLKINSKEYKPIKKVMDNLEKYNTKLRRKEAVVADKKIAMYGVNKFVDIDKEQAEKVLNESELLDGLRLSVQHCEEVIAANKDRFPILEHTNKILTENIANLEQDIENTKKVLEAIRNKNGGEGSNGEDEE